MNKKKWTMVGILLMVVICIGYIIIGIKQMPEKLLTGNGDNILINEIDYSTVLSDDKFVVFSEQEYLNKFKTTENLGVNINIPIDIENMQHFYQMKKEDGKIIVYPYDEVFLWETKKYRIDESDTIKITRNDGVKDVIADRGYVELTVTRAEKPMQRQEHIFADEMYLAMSYLNGKTVIAKKRLYTSEKDKGTYEVTIKDAYGKGVNAFIVANNISEEYFVRLLEIITGTETSFKGIKY